jgi:hypothetical protein
MKGTNAGVFTVTMSALRQCEEGGTGVSSPDLGGMSKATCPLHM